ncbi:facilitated trehalose transporter Tret1-like isoform X1 [Plodia interpunctella]|uniref:facilitated trehalose transporter Tret1-like isoform X1 n=3 Tax=Plodia interpunctella TaxID=58824 RepID=UPI002367551D|nr:facilitated trehalose transporter Tret1-like isoform X1 [Plodia interpunctella]
MFLPFRNFLLTFKWQQYLAASLASYGSLCTGMAMGWTSPVLPQLRGENSPLPREPTLQEESWIGSLLVLGGLFGPLITVPLSKYVGRRWIIMSTNLPLLLGWLLAGVATDLGTLYVARLLWGCATGMLFATVPIYIGEIAEDKIRGSLSALFLLFINVGFLLAYAIGPFTSYWGLTAAGGILSLFYLPCTWFIPETPFFLVFKGRHDEASAVLQKLRGSSKEAVQPELEGLQALVTREFQEEPRIQDLWASRGNVKALGICVFLAMLLQLSGIDVLLFYMEELLAKVGTSISASDGTIIMGVVQVVTSCVTPLVVDKLGRKLLMWTTSLGLTIFLFLIGVYALLDSYFKYDLSSVAFIPLLCLIIYMILFTLGVGPVPWILVAEMFPVKTKCLASGICSFMCWLAGFIWTRFFRDVAASYGIYTAFWILAVCCGIGFIFSATLLPETKGKTFDEIQDLLNNRSKEEKSADDV